MQKFLSLIALSAGTALALAFTACSPKSEIIDPRIAIMDDADAVIQMDLRTMRESAFAKVAEKLSGAAQENLPPDLKAIQDTLGITEDDVDSFVLSIDNINVLPKQEWNALRMVAGMSVKQKVTQEQLKEAMKLSAENSQSDLEDIQQEQFEGTTLYKIQYKANEPSIAFCLLSGEQSVFLMGDTQSVKDAVSRSASGRISDDGAYAYAMQTGMTQKQGWMMIAFPPEIQNLLRNTAANPQTALIGPAAQALGGLTHFGWSANAADALKIELFASVQDEQAAITVKGFLDSMVAGSGRMLSQQQFGAVPDLINSMTTQVQQNTLRLNTQLTENDLILFERQGNPQP